MNFRGMLAVFVLSLPLAATPVVATGQNQQQSPDTNQTADKKSGETKAETAGHREPARFLSGNDPDYSDSAREHHVEGTIILAVALNEKGKVKSVKIVSPLESSLDRRAVNAVKHWKFAPATLDGKPVASEFNVSVDFRLNR